MSEEKVLTLRGKRAVWAPAPAGVGGGGVTLYAMGDKLIKSIPVNWIDTLDFNTMTAPWLEYLSADEQKEIFDKAMETAHGLGSVKMLMIGDGVIVFDNVITTPKTAEDGGMLVFSSISGNDKMAMCSTTRITKTESGVNITFSTVSLGSGGAS